MVRQWIEPIFDRTYGDVTALQLNPDDPITKGAWNKEDLNRIEKNTAYCVEWMLQQKIYRTDPMLRIEESDFWTDNEVADNDQIRRVINNVIQILERSKENPAIADKLPNIYPATQMNYQLANDIEYALYLMHDQPKLPVEYFKLKLNNGIIKYITRLDGTVENIMQSEALIAEDEVATIIGVEYGDDAQYQVFQYWNANNDPLDLDALGNYKDKETTYTGQYRDVEFTANFITKIPRTLSLTNGYISVTGSPTASSGPNSGTYYAGDKILIIALVAPSGKAFYEWLGTPSGLENLTGKSETDPSVCQLVMPDEDVSLYPRYVNASGNKVVVNYGSGSGIYKYNELVSISADVPEHYGFDKWSGDVGVLEDYTNPYQTFRMPDNPLTFTNVYSYRYSYNDVQVINGLISVNGQNVSEASGLRQTNTYTLVPTPPDSSKGILSWTVEGKGHVSTDSLGNDTNTFNVGDGNAIITGNYAPIRTITVKNVNNGGGTSSYSVVQGRKQRFTTTSSTGSYRFNGWYENDTRISTSTTLDITVGTENRTIEARYDYYATYTVTLINRNNSGETTTSQVLSGNYWSSSTNEEVGDYLLVGWNKNGTQVSTSTSYGFYVSSDTTIEVVYRPKETYHLTVNNGTGSGDYKERQSVTITADDGDFSDWSTSNIYSIGSRYSKTTTVKLGRGNGSVTANYNLRQITVITNSGTNTYSVRQGDRISINALPAPNTYEWDASTGWEVVSGDATFSNRLSSNTYVYANSQDSTVRATYKAIPKFTVTMIDGYIWNGSEYVEQATLLRNSTNEIKLKQGAVPLGHQFLQWEVYVDGVKQTNPDDVYEILAETTRLRNLLRDITIKATFYVPDPEVKYTLTIHRQNGNNEQEEYSVGEQPMVNASSPLDNMKFYRWEGDYTYLLAGRYEPDNRITMPAANIELTETYKPLDWVVKYHLYMVSNAECKYQTSSVDSETGEEIITDHWVTDWEYEEGKKVEIRTKAIPDGWRFTEWRVQDSNGEDMSSILTSLKDNVSSFDMPPIDIYVTAGIEQKETYKMVVTDGEENGSFYEGKKVDIYFSKQNTEDIHYKFNRWTGSTLTELELWDGGMFKATVGTKQSIKMPKKDTTIVANYDVLYHFIITDGTIDSEEEYFVPNTTLNITANKAPEGMKFQRWEGDTEYIANPYDPTTTIKTAIGITRIHAVYSTIESQNSIGYTLTDLTNNNIIDNDNINIITENQEITQGMIITDIKGHVYVVTNVGEPTSTIVRMTRTVEGGDVYE